MSDRARALAVELDALRAEAGDAPARRKLDLVRALATTPARTRATLERVHEALLFLRAWPDDEHVLGATDEALSRFAERLRTFGEDDIDAMSETGMAGTPVRSTFSLPVVRWLMERFPDAVRYFDEGEGAKAQRDATFARALGLAESEGIADGYVTGDEWLRKTAPEGADTLRRLVAVVDALDADDAAREALWASCELPVEWALGEGSRTLVRAPYGSPAFRTRPFDRRRPALRAYVRKPPFPVRRVRGDEARRWIDAAMAAVTARLREMYTFMHASADDVSVVTLRDGMEMALWGVLPARRYVFRTYYGYLLARNGVPVGYGDVVAMFDRAEVNFHVFETFRQVGSARIYADVLRGMRHHFGVRHVFLNRYQFGHHNEEAIRTGAFWFYERLGFRPADPEVRALWKAERARLAATPGARSPASTLRRLASGDMYLSLDDAEAELKDLYPRFHPMHLAMAWTRRVETEYGGDRHAAIRAATSRAERVLGIRGDHVTGLAPLLALISDVEEWSITEKKGLARLIEMKWGVREIDYLHAAQEHERIRTALLRAGAG